MGFTPDQVGRMSLFQFASCVEGVCESRGGDTIEAPSDEEFLNAVAANEALTRNG